MTAEIARVRRNCQLIKNPRSKPHRKDRSAIGYLTNFLVLNSFEDWRNLTNHDAMHN